MSEVTKRLVEERLGIWNRVQDILKRSETADGGLSGELLAQFNAAEADMRAKGEELEARQRAERMESELRQVQPANVGGGDTTESRTAGAEAEQRDAQFWEYVKRGKVGPELEFRDLGGVDTGAAGGFLIPQGFRDAITIRQKYFGPMRQVSNVITTSSGQDLPWPTADDTGVVAAVLGENVAASEADVTIGQKTLKAYVWSSGIVRAPNTLLNDSVFDIQAFLVARFADRFGRGQNTAFTNGAGHGSNTAQGIVPGLQAGANLRVTSAGPTAITYADLVGLRFAIDNAYRANGSFMVSDDALRQLFLLTDTNGRPIFVPAGSFGSIAEGSPDTLLGRPLYTNNDLATVGAGAVCVLFGDFTRAYIIRDVLEMQTLRLTERYAEFLQTAFLAFMRTDAVVDDSYAAAYLVQHA